MYIMQQSGCKQPPLGGTMTSQAGDDLATQAMLGGYHSRARRAFSAWQECEAAEDSDETTVEDAWQAFIEARDAYREYAKQNPEARDVYFNTHQIVEAPEGWDD